LGADGATDSDGGGGGSEADSAGDRSGEWALRLLHGRPRLLKLAANPLMCVLLCLTLRHERGRLPEASADLFATLLRFVMGRSLRQRQVILFFLLENQQENSPTNRISDVGSFFYSPYHGINHFVSL